MIPVSGIIFIIYGLFLYKYHLNSSKYHRMNAFHVFKSVREYMTPVLQQSAFLEQGMLTPEEFVKAGDHLIRTCPTWKWESGEVSKRRPYLPPDKQFLSTSGVPCYRRVNDLESANYVDQMIESESAGEEWLAPQLISLGVEAEDGDLSIIGAEGNEEQGQGHNKEGSDQQKEVESNPNSKTTNPDPSTIKDSKSSGPSKTPMVSSKAGIDNEYLDMEDESLALDDSTEANRKMGADENSIIKSRRYDVSITYDNYYRTPRIWLFGYNENGSPLSPEEIYQDVMQDYAKKTVTVDPHPHLSRQHASIHPCRHGSAMLKIIEALQECNQTPTVEQYLFVFLKFIQSVVPTIEYDYTIDVQARKADA